MTCCGYFYDVFELLLVHLFPPKLGSRLSRIPTDGLQFASLSNSGSKLRNFVFSPRSFIFRLFCCLESWISSRDSHCNLGRLSIGLVSIFVSDIDDHLPSKQFSFCSWTDSEQSILCIGNGCYKLLKQLLPTNWCRYRSRSSKNKIESQNFELFKGRGDFGF